MTEKYLGSGVWIEDSSITMGGEDFAYYLEKVPGALLQLGLGEDSQELHSSDFDFNDKAIPRGVALHCGPALEFLSP